MKPSIYLGSGPHLRRASRRIRVQPLVVERKIYNSGKKSIVDFFFLKKAASMSGLRSNKDLKKETCVGLAL